MTLWAVQASCLVIYTFFIPPISSAYVLSIPVSCQVTSRTEMDQVIDDLGFWQEVQVIEGSPRMIGSIYRVTQSLRYPK